VKSDTTIDCIYCGKSGERSREHVVPRWLWEELGKTGDFINASRERHAFAGNARVPDVCVRCNTGPLKVLDEEARSWWVGRGESLDPVLDAPTPRIGRWCAKIAVNFEQLEAKKESVGIWVPRIPTSIKSWIVEGGPAPPEIAVCAAALPADHYFALDSGFYGSGDRTIGSRVLQLRGLMFYVVWHDPFDPASQTVPQLLDYIRKHHPSVTLDLDKGGAPVILPLVPNPDGLTLGIYDDPVLVAKMRAHLAKRKAANGS
jgi:hypothetical protein